MKKLFAAVLMSTAFGAVAADAPPQYATSCGVCHTSGLGGQAPMSHNVAEWEPRLAKGMPVLLESVKNGMGNMLAGGMCPTCTDEEYTALIEFMAAPAN